MLNMFPNIIYINFSLIINYKNTYNELSIFVNLALLNLNIGNYRLISLAYEECNNR